MQFPNVVLLNCSRMRIAHLYTQMKKTTVDDYGNCWIVALSRDLCDLAACWFHLYSMYLNSN